MSMSRRRGQELLASSNTASSYSSGFSYPTLQPAVATAVAAPSSAASVQPPPPPQLPPKPQELSIAASNAPAPPPPAVHHQYSNMYRSASADAQLNVMASSMPSRTSSMTPGAVKLDNNRPLAVATNVNGYDRNPRGQGLPQQQPSFTSALGPAARSSSPSHSASTNRYYSPVSSVAPPPPLPPKPRSRATSRAGESSLHSNNMVAGASSSSSSSSLSNNLAVYEDRSVATQNRLSFSQLGSTTVGVVGLKNLGNTCFLNSIIQCLSATVPLSRYFLGGSFRRHINRANTFGSRGEIAETYSQLVKTMWSEQDPIVTPIRFKDIVGKFAPQFQGNEQHDSQEFLIFLLDAIHEDLNLGRRRVPGKEEEEDKEEPDFIASEKAWNLYSQSNWSIIVDMFQGQMRSKLTCLSCNKVGCEESNRLQKAESHPFALPFLCFR